MPNKPKTREELLPSFDWSVQQLWLQQLKLHLSDFGVPDAEHISKQDLTEAESQLQVKLPQPFRDFLLEVGPVHFDGVVFWPPRYIRVLKAPSDLNNTTSETDTQHNQLLGIADYLSGTAIVAIETSTGRVCLVSLSPPALSNWLDSFTNLIKVVLQGF
jgi:hypothetical protein